MASEWEKRKHSDLLSDNLMNTIYTYFDQYITEYRRMEEETRTKAVVSKANKETAFVEDIIKTEPQKVTLDETWNESHFASNWFSYSRSRSKEDRNSGSRSHTRECSYNTGRKRSRGRSKSRSWRRRSGNSINRKKENDSRDPTSVTTVNASYDRIYTNDTFFHQNSLKLGQVMIVDCGCPRSLMGDKEYEKLKRTFKTQKMKGSDLDHQEPTLHSLKLKYP